MWMQSPMAQSVKANFRKHMKKTVHYGNRVFYFWYSTYRVPARIEKNASELVPKAPKKYLNREWEDHNILEDNYIRDIFLTSKMIQVAVRPSGNVPASQSLRFESDQCRKLVIFQYPPLTSQRTLRLQYQSRWKRSTVL